MERFENVGEGPRRSEKVGEGRRRLEKVEEGIGSSRLFDNVGERW